MNLKEYKFNAEHNLGTPHTGGTDWRCITYFVSDAFKEVLFIAEPESILEIGFNAGASALLFLMINPKLHYHSIDIVENQKSVAYIGANFKRFRFYKKSSFDLPDIRMHSVYDLVFIDGDHSEEGVRNDIEKSLLFNPKYILLDDFKHPSHSYIEKIILEDERFEVVKVWEFNEIWDGYSMALCKVINN